MYRKFLEAIDMMIQQQFSLNEHKELMLSANSYYLAQIRTYGTQQNIDIQTLFQFITYVRLFVIA